MPKVIVCFEASKPDGFVWAVKVGRTWTCVKDVAIHIPMVTVYNGPTARQPRAYLLGEGHVSFLTFRGRPHTAILTN